MTQHTILIIDDESGILDALERTLRNKATILLAQSGPEGLALIQKHSVSMVICDQRMPDMTGIDFFKELIQKQPNAVRIILTAYTDVKDLIEAINDIGIYRYVTKPWDNHDLELVVRRGLERFELEEQNRKLVCELKLVNLGLEKKVDQRTQELHEANQKLKDLSLTDELTTVGNQRFFRQQLAAELERSIRYKHPLSLLLIDIDYFKSYNDEFGHAIGDRALSLVAKTLKSKIRTTDFLARTGGEEFAILLPETPKLRAKETAERIRLAIEKKIFPYKIKRKKRKGLTISIGLATYPQDQRTKDPKKLMQKSDKALYRAKGKGKNRVELY